MRFITPYIVNPKIWAFIPLLHFMFSFGQNSVSNELYNVFDDTVGQENIPLYQGIVHYEKYRTINAKVQFHKSVDFLRGGVQYDGQWYYGLYLKYDVFSDEVLFRATKGAGVGAIQLFKEYLSRFEIDGEHFMKISEDDAPSLDIVGFYSISQEGPYFGLYIKYIKRRIGKKDRKVLYYEFFDAPSKYVLFYNGEFQNFNTKREVLGLFPDFHKEINSFYRAGKRKQKIDPDGFTSSLATHIEGLIEESHKTILE